MIEKKIYIIRQSAVLPSDFSKPKNWREIFLYKWSKKNFHHAELWISNFDHYALKQRRKIDVDFHRDIVAFNTIGYKKTVSISRIIDAWIFGFKIFFRALKRVKKGDVVIVSLPTPESVFFICLGKLFKRYTVIIDVRDNWPSNFTGRGLIKRLFSLYVHLLNKFNFLIVDKVIWMSAGLYDQHDKKGLLKREDLNHSIIPVTYYRDMNFKDNSQFAPELFNRPVISFFGTLNEQFDLTILNDCLENSNLASEFNFIIIGDGNQYNSLHQTFNKFENVFFTKQLPYAATQFIAERSEGFFLFYRDPETYSNHVTNKIREYAEFRKPIIHNLPSNIFTLDDDKYYIGASIKMHNFHNLIEEIMINDNASIYNLDNLDRFCKQTSIEGLEEKFIKTVSSV